MRQIQNEKKRKLKIGAVIIVLLVGILFLSVRITQVDVTGNKQYTQEEIVGFLFPDNKSRNTLLCFLQDRLKKHIQIPFVEDYEIVFQAPNRVEVIVYGGLSPR